MLVSSTKVASRVVTLLVGLGLVLAACDMAGEQQSSDEPILRVTNDLGERMTVFEQGKTVPTSNRKAAPAKSAFTLRAVSRIDPPNNGQHASHLSKTEEGPDEQSVFVGYKVPGSTFGGGIDILDASDPTDLGNEDNALRSPDLDVQEVLYDAGSPNRLYVAGAVDFGKIDARDYGNSPAVILQGTIDNDGNVDTDGDGDVQVVEAALPNRVVKGLALKPTGNSPHHGDSDIYAVTDSSALFSFENGLGVRQVSDIGDSDVEQKSVATHRASGNLVYTLTKEGEVYSFDGGGGINNIANFGDLEKNGIARISFFEFTDSGVANIDAQSQIRVLFAALNKGGLAVMDASNGDVYFEKSDQYYVSVVGAQHDVDGPGGDDVARVFAAGPNGTIDVYEVSDDDELTSSSTSTSKGLQLLGSFDLGGLEEDGIGSDPLGSGQVNQIVVEDDNLFVAAGDEGVLTLEIAENEGDIF